jgi:outer membrane protein assembly factor BamD
MTDRSPAVGRPARRSPWIRLALPGILVLAACNSGGQYLQMGAEDLYAWSTAAFNDENWDDAVEGYERMIFMFPAHDSIVQVRLNLARSYYERNEYVTASAEFARLIDRHPTHPLVASASLGVCESYAALSPIPERDQEFTQTALNSCTSILLDFPGTPEAQRAREIRDNMINKLAEKEYLRGYFYFRRGFYDSANVYFEQVLSLYPRSPSAANSLLRMLEGYERIGYEEEAEEVRSRLLREYPDSEAASTVRASRSAPQAVPDTTAVPDTSGVVR